MNYSIFKKNSFAVLNSYFEIGSNIQIIGKRELNKPLILCFNCTMIKLSKKESGGCNFSNWMNITYNYDDCVDIISLRSNLNSITDSDTNFLRENNFPVINEGLYLMANNKLIRYCKNKTNINREVECVITKHVYNKNPQSNSFSFDYPHCPCTSDKNSISNN